MATAEHVEAAPDRGDDGEAGRRRVPARERLRRSVPALATVVGVAAGLKLLFGPWYLNYDARYALLWARDAARGVTPDFEAAFAPTPHPLSTAWSALALPFGDGGDQLMVWLALLSLGALTLLAYRLGAELFSPAVGIVTALAVATRPALVRDALLGYQDLPFACLVVGAVLLEARRRAAGSGSGGPGPAAVLGLVALAGLLRPEAWVLAGLYWLSVARHRSWGERVRLGALAAVGPVVWALMDLAVTGDPLHSLHGTSALAETADRRRHVHQVPYWTAQYFGYVLREPLLVAVPIGLAFAFRHRLRAAVLPLAAAGAMVAVFAVGPVFGLPLIGRYVRTPSVLLALFAGLAVCGWALRRTPVRERRAWQAAAAVAVLASVVYLPWHVGMLADLEGRVDRHGAMYADLRATARSAAVTAAAERCGAIAAADHRPVPYLRYWLGGDPGSVVTLEGGTGTGRVLLLPRRARVTQAFYRENFPRVRPPAGFRLVHRNRSWRVLAAPECA